MVACRKFVHCVSTQCTLKGSLVSEKHTYSEKGNALKEIITYTKLWIIRVLLTGELDMVVDIGFIQIKYFFCDTLIYYTEQVYLNHVLWTSIFLRRNNKNCSLAIQIYIWYYVDEYKPA